MQNIVFHSAQTVLTSARAELAAFQLSPTAPNFHAKNQEKKPEKDLIFCVELPQTSKSSLAVGFLVFVGGYATIGA